MNRTYNPLGGQDLRLRFPVNKLPTVIDLTREEDPNEIYQMERASKTCWCTKCKNLVYPSHTSQQCEMNIQRTKMNRKKSSPMFGRFFPVQDWTKNASTMVAPQSEANAVNRSPNDRRESRPESTSSTDPVAESPSETPSVRLWTLSPATGCQPGYPNLHRAVHHAKVNIEGNIGCGKTTFLNLLRTRVDIDILDLSEPVQNWTNTSGLNLLYHFYLKPKKWKFQTKVVASLLENHHRSADYGKIMERSIATVQRVFLPALDRRHHLTPIQSNILHDLCRAAKTPLVKNDFTIYLRASPEICYERVKKRGRLEESPINITYLQLLHELHEDWLGGHGTDNV